MRRRELDWEVEFVRRKLPKGIARRVANLSLSACSINLVPGIINRTIVLVRSPPSLRVSVMNLCGITVHPFPASFRKLRYAGITS
jgi:hypothetical protein